MNKSVSLGGEPFLTAQHLSHRFSDGTHALNNVSFSLARGTFTALIGPSGVGKSTLLRILADLHPPTAGHVTYHPPNPKIGVVFQNNNLMPWRTAAANIRLPLELAGELSPAAITDRVTTLLDLVGLTEFATSYPAQLSGGMAQRIAIARALSHHPDLLLLDEPFGALDALTRERMASELLHIWRANPVTVLLVTHSITEAVLLADDVLVINPEADGRGGTLTHHHPISLPRPRQQSLTTTTPFHHHTQTLRQSLRLS